MIPHARLQPSAPSSILRTSLRAAPITLNEQVKVSTMISPKRISEIRSIGSSRRFDDWLVSLGMGNLVGIHDAITALMHSARRRA